MDETSDRGRLATGAVSVDPGPLGVVRATGNDRIPFLHRLLTADVARVTPGGGTQALLLNTKGHVIAALLLLVRGDDLLLLTPPGEGEAAAAALSRYAVMDDVTTAPEPGLAVRALLGPATEARLLDLGLPIPGGARWAHVGGETTEGPVTVVRARSLGADGAFLIAAPATLAALEGRLAGLGVARLSAEAAEAARLEAGEPRWGAEITLDVFPMEVGLSASIDYGKGCYLGQEPIVRIRDRGHINWRLVRLRAARPFAAGDRLSSEAKPKAGRVTSALSLPGGETLGLALLHTSLPDTGAVSVLPGEADGAGGEAITAQVFPIPS